MEDTLRALSLLLFDGGVVSGTASVEARSGLGALA